MDEAGYFGVLLECRPGMKVFAQFPLTECGVNFSVADTVYWFFDLAAAAFGQQVVLVNAGARQHGPAAQRAVGQCQRLDVAQRFSAAQAAFGNHVGKQRRIFSVLARQKSVCG